MSTAEAKSSDSKIPFAAMATTYCLGVFNDNFFKQTAMLLAVSTGLSQLQGYATVLFALPFILFSAYGGWCADRFSKKSVLIIVKGLEVFALFVGGIGLISSNWPMILSMVFLMGIQSTFFSPALNGSIPEMYSSKQVPRINAILKLATTLAILLGIALAGICLDLNAVKALAWLDRYNIKRGVGLVVAVAIITAITGFLASFALAKRPSAKGSQPFPWTGPLNSIKDCFILSNDRHLMLGFICEAWFYFISVLTIQLINTMGIKQCNLGQTRTSLLAMSLMLGICVGSLIAAKVTKVEKWYRYIPASAVGMGFFLAITGLVEMLPTAWHFPYILISLAAAGCAGGLFIIPTATILQIHPQKDEKGRVLSVASFCSFTAIFLAGILFSMVDEHFPPTNIIVSAGTAAVLFAFFLRTLIGGQEKDSLSSGPRKAIALILRNILSLRYTTEVQGLDTIKKRTGSGILFLPNHPALIDPVLVTCQLFTNFAPRPLSHAQQLESPLIRLITSIVRPITIPDSHIGDATARKKVFEGMQEVVSALANGENILLYPAGQLSRTGNEDIGENSAVEYILKKCPRVQIVLVRITGLWGSSFSHAFARPSLFAHFGLYLLALAANMFFFIPKRPVYLEFCEDSLLKNLKERRQINNHLERYYNAIPNKPVKYPLFWWQKS